MQANRPDESAKVDTAANRREAGAIQTKLCKEYGESLKATPTPAPVSDMEKLARNFVDAFNQGDVDAALAFFVDEQPTYFYRGFSAHDKEALRDAFEYGSGVGNKIELVDCKLEGQALGCAVLERDDYCLKAQCGLDVWHVPMTIKAKGDKIELMSFMSDSATEEDQKACDEVYPKFETWAEANRPDEWKKWKAPVAYDLKGRPLGELFSVVCKAYLEATKK